MSAPCYESSQLLTAGQGLIKVFVAQVSGSYPGQNAQLQKSYSQKQTDTAVSADSKKAWKCELSTTRAVLPVVPDRCK